MSTRTSVSQGQTITGFLNHYTYRFFQGKTRNWDCVYCVFEIGTGLFQIFHPEKKALYFKVKIQDVEIVRA